MCVCVCVCMRACDALLANDVCMNVVKDLFVPHTIAGFCGNCKCLYVCLCLSAAESNPAPAGTS